MVFYGDKSNWWAAYALWVFSLFGHPDVRLLDGGRAKWEAEGRAMTTECRHPSASDYPVVARDDAPIRAFRDEVLAHLGKPLIDVRSPDEYTGGCCTWPATRRRARCAAATSPARAIVPWARAANEDGTFKSRAELEALYGGEVGLAPDDDVVVYCRIGERSSHTWFALTHLLGFDARAQLRRLVDRVGQQRARADRARGGPDVTGGCLRRGWRRSSRSSPPRRRGTGWNCCSSTRSRCPPLPERYAQHPERLERVPECQSPLFVAAEVDDDGRAHLYFDSPPESPTTRGFAGIFHAGLDGGPAEEVLAVPADITERMALAEVVSPLRLRGAAAMLYRLQRQVRALVPVR